MRYPIYVTALALALSANASAQQEQTIKNLADRLSGGDGSAAAQLVKHGKAAVPSLIAILKSDAKSLVRGHAAHALGRIGADANAAVPALAAALVEIDMAEAKQRLSDEASIALGRIGPASTAVLVKTLGHKNPQVRALAAGALKQIKPLPKSAAPAIIAAFKKSTKSTHLETLYLIDLIGELGTDAKEAVPLVTEIAKKSLKFTGIPQASNVAIQSISVHALHAIGKMGPAAKEAMPFVLEVIKAKQAGVTVRILAVEVLGNLGSAAEKAAPAIVELMKSDEGPPNMVLLKCLAKIGFSGDPSMKQALYQAMLDKHAETRVYAARILGQKTPNDLTVVSVLLEAIRHPNADTRLLAAQTLAVVRPADESVVELLQQARKDADGRVRMAAETALKKYKK